MKVSVSTYEQVREILDAAAGSAQQPSYGGHGRFWNLPLAEFLEVTLYGVRMIAPLNEAAATPPEQAADDSCCERQAPSEVRRSPGRGARSGLVVGLKGDWPFDGTQFPRLPWGGTAVAPADVDLIANWIDAGCPEKGQAAAPEAAPAPPDALPVQVLDPDDTNSFKQQAGEPMLRQNVEHLSATELANLRQAVQAVMDLNAWPHDIRAYNSWAQIHGDECPHGWSTFMPWHRMYLWEFEQALKDTGCATVMLPYWDWTQSTPEQVAAGYIPEAYRCFVTDEMLTRLGGEVPASTLKRLDAVLGQTFCSITKFWTATNITDADDRAKVIAQLKVVNPLFSELRFPGEFTTPGQFQDAFHMHYPTQQDVDNILAIETWRDFGGGMDVDQSFGVVDMVPHNTMHVWIGGQPSAAVAGLMTDNLTAAFDPIFWAHHGNVDRLWARWQERHPGVDPSDPSDVLPGVNSTVEDSLSIGKLGYEYAADTYVLPTEPGAPPGKLASPDAGVGAAVLANHRRAEVRMHAVRQPEHSFLVRIFLNHPAADETTPVLDNEHYAGHFTLFGHGPCIGGPGHCEPRPRPIRAFDRRTPHHNEPWNIRFDVTDTVRRLTAKGETDLQVTLVPISPSGNGAALQMKAVSLTFHD